MGVMKEGMTDFNSTQQNLVNAVGNHMAKSSEVTKDDLYNFMKEFQLELKKNSYGYEGSSSLLTPFDRRE
jgi:flagellar motor switch protein FliG